MPAPPHPWLGLDVGTRRIGVALSNPLGIAQPLLTIQRTQPRRDQRSILRLARRHACAGIVVGNPLHLSGDTSRQTERVHRFIDELKALIAESDHPSLPVHLWDERLSTAEAHAALEAGVPKLRGFRRLGWKATGRNPAERDARRHMPNRGREIIDQAAAAIILQGWLDAQRGVVTLLPEP
jgi:putative Holliday junction resolvase